MENVYSLKKNPFKIDLLYTPHLILKLDIFIGVISLLTSKRVPVLARLRKGQ
jgi:hypothetical protein